MLGNNDNTHIYYYLDLFMAEYGWSFKDGLDFVLNTPYTIVKTLYETMIKRQIQEQRIDCKIQAMSIGAALSGKSKEIDKVFNKLEGIESDEHLPTEDEHKSNLYAMWKGLGKGSDWDEFEKLYKEGKLKF